MSNPIEQAVILNVISLSFELASRSPEKRPKGLDTTEDLLIFIDNIVAKFNKATPSNNNNTDNVIRPPFGKN